MGCLTLIGTAIPPLQDTLPYTSIFGGAKDLPSVKKQPFCEG